MDELLQELGLEKYAQALSEAGYETLEDLAVADEKGLMLDASMRRPEARRVCRHFNNEQREHPPPVRTVKQVQTSAPAESKLPEGKEFAYFCSHVSAGYRGRIIWLCITPYYLILYAVLYAVQLLT